jgi:hypothetical protein
MSIRVFPINGTTVKALVPPPPAPTQRAYSATAGGFVDVPGDASGDTAAILPAGFFAVGASGPTTARPNGVGGVGPGYVFIDTTLALVVVWDGVNWRNPVTGATA